MVVIDLLHRQSVEMVVVLYFWIQVPDSDLAVFFFVQPSSWIDRRTPPDPISS